LRGANQLVNAGGVLAALAAMRESLPVTAQAVRNGLVFVDLPGRFQIVPGQPTLVLDVAHNPHAAAALALNLDAMGYFPCTHAVFGAMADKDIAAVLARMGPVVDRWYFTDLPTARAARATDLQSLWQVQNSRSDALSEVFIDPESALMHADRFTPSAASSKTVCLVCRPNIYRHPEINRFNLHGFLQVSQSKCRARPNATCVSKYRSPAPARQIPSGWRFGARAAGCDRLSLAV
jgi:folylpolyglutamate synthase/dihydropteroate synthase